MTLAKIETLRKSFDDATYNDTKKKPTISHSMKDELKIYPLDKFTAPEGISE